MAMSDEERKAYTAAWYEANKEGLKAYKNAWYKANKDMRDAKSRAYHEANKEKVIARIKTYRENNRDKFNACSAADGRANRKDIQTWVELHPDLPRAEVLVLRKQYYKEHPEELKAWRKAARDAALAELEQQQQPTTEEQHDTDTQ
jgi:hypothetical protein